MSWRRSRPMCWPGSSWPGRRPACPVTRSARTCCTWSSCGRGPAGPDRLWIQACIDPFGSRSELVRCLRQTSRSPLEEPALWRIGSAAWLLDESDLAITLLQDAMQLLRAPGTQGTSGPGLTALGWAFIDTGRWDEAQEAAAEAADVAEANQMDLVAASADLIAATVLARRAD